MTQRLKEQYNKEVLPQLMKDFKYKSVMQVPKLDKIVLNVGVGEAVKEIKALDGAVRDLTKIHFFKPLYIPGQGGRFYIKFHRFSDVLYYLLI